MRNELLEKAKLKNQNLTELERLKNVEWKVRGNYGRHNLRLVRTKPNAPAVEEAEE